jgi:hypothetical protein
LASSSHTTATDTILIGDLAPHGTSGLGAPGVNGQMYPVRFARALYCLSSTLKPLIGAAAAARGCPTTAAGHARFAAQNPALFQASGFAVHPYEYLDPPTVAEPGLTGAGYVDFASLSHITRLLDGAAAAYGVHRQMPIFNTEYGYHTNPPGDIYGNALPLATAAAYLNETEYLSWRNPRIRSFDQYLLADPAPSSGSDFVSGLEFDNGTAKPIYYDAYRMPLWLPRTRAAGGSALEVWGCARPADSPLAHGPQRVAIQFKRAAHGGGGWRTLRMVKLTAAGGCYFDSYVTFPGSGLVRLAYGRGAGLIHSRSQAITLR